MRLARHPDSASAPLTIGADVLARGHDGRWNRGEILELKEDGPSILYRVVRKGKEPRWMNRLEITLSSDPPDDTGVRYEIGDRVKALWDEGIWYSGSIGCAYGKIYRIDFDDGDVAWFHPDRIQFVEKARTFHRRRMLRLGLGAAGLLLIGLVGLEVVLWSWTKKEETTLAGLEAVTLPDIPPPMLTRPDEVPAAGTMVLSRFADSDFCFLSRIGTTKKTSEGTEIEVLYLDGDKELRGKNDIYNDVLGPGSRVDARFQDGQYYPGTVKERNRSQLYVVYDDGDHGWYPLEAIRVHCR